MQPAGWAGLDLRMLLGVTIRLEALDHASMHAAADLALYLRWMGLRWLSLRCEALLCHDYVYHCVPLCRTRRCWPLLHSMLQIARTDSASTNALMRMYQTAIAQHQRASTSSLEEQLMSGEEIEVIAKAGQGAFGSVYVAMWKGLVVAVKVMKQQQEGRRAMRTAWELAVTKSLQHSNVVSVHAVLTDVVVEKRSKRSIRFMPSTPQAVDIGSSSLVPSLLGQSQPTEQEAADSPRCQVTHLDSDVMRVAVVDDVVALLLLLLQQLPQLQENQLCVLSAAV